MFHNKSTKRLYFIFYYIKSPSFVRTNDYKPIEFQEKLSLSQLEAKHALSVNSLILKYGRSTTRRLLKKLIVLPRVIGVLNSFLIVLFLITIYIWYNLAWLYIYSLLFICFKKNSIFINLLTISIYKSVINSFGTYFFLFSRSIK